jgi:hypothetical protein
MACYCTVDPEAAIRPGPETERRPSHAQWYPLRAEDGLHLGGCAPHIRLAGHVLAALPYLGDGRDLGADLADLTQPARCPGQARMGAGVFGRQCRPGEKRGTGVGKTTVGQGAKVMVVADGHGRPIGVYGDSA